MGNSHRRCGVCGEANHSCGPSDPTVQPVDIIEERSPNMGEVKNYNVGGIDQGNGVPFPHDTVLRLDDDTAERMGLKKPSKKRDEDDGNATPQAKPARPPATRKRGAPAKGAAKRGAPAKK